MKSFMMMFLEALVEDMKQNPNDYEEVTKEGLLWGIYDFELEELNYEIDQLEKDGFLKALVRCYILGKELKED